MTLSFSRFTPVYQDELATTTLLIVIYSLLLLGSTVKLLKILFGCEPKPPKSKKINYQTDGDIEEATNSQSTLRKIRQSFEELDTRLLFYRHQVLFFVFMIMTTSGRMLFFLSYIFIIFGKDWKPSFRFDILAEFFEMISAFFYIYVFFVILLSWVEKYYQIKAVADFFDIGTSSRLRSRHKQYGATFYHSEPSAAGGIEEEYGEEGSAEVNDDDTMYHSLTAKHSTGSPTGYSHGARPGPHMKKSEVRIYFVMQIIFILCTMSILFLTVLVFLTALFKMYGGSATDQWNTKYRVSVTAVHVIHSIIMFGTAVMFFTWGTKLLLLLKRIVANNFLVVLRLSDTGSSMPTKLVRVLLKIFAITSVCCIVLTCKIVVMGMEEVVWITGAEGGKLDKTLNSVWFTPIYFFALEAVPMSLLLLLVWQRKSPNKPSTAKRSSLPNSVSPMVSPSASPARPKFKSAAPSRLAVSVVDLQKDAHSPGEVGLFCHTDTTSFDENIKSQLPESKKKKKKRRTKKKNSSSAINENGEVTSIPDTDQATDSPIYTVEE